MKFSTISKQSTKAFNALTSEAIMKPLRMAATLLLYVLSITQIFTQTRYYNTQALKREMRGIWVATVNNIDWPSSPGLSNEGLMRETRAILDRVKRMGLNTVFIQVRPSSDAIYRSDIEPITSYIVANGNDKLGTFDPLTYWIEQAHLRGLELHAWINPFRVTPKPDFPCADNHISKTHPEWTVEYAGKLYLDPGYAETRQYVVSIVDDIASRYDIDGIHFDDYFYPYPVKGATFDDSKSFAANNPTRLSLADWRRQNVDYVISEVHKHIKSIKPWLAFGVSPFGVWRNKADDSEGSNTRAGITNYDILYANVTKWIDKKWIDYVVPQIYWEAGNKAADFDELTKWWAARGKDKTQVFVGHAIFKINAGAKVWENPNEMPSQINKVRSNSGLNGSVFFSYRQFNRDLLGLENTLQDRLYKNQALTPLACPQSITDEITVTKLKRRGAKLTWDTDADSDAVRFYAVYRYKKGEEFDHDINTHLYDIVGTNEIALPRPQEAKTKYIYRVSAIDKHRREHPLSKRIVIKQ